MRQYASLVSQEAFVTLAGQYPDTLDSSAPPINVAGLDPNYQPVSLPFISQAHASEGESSFVWGLVNWFIPIEDFGIVLEQLSYWVSDSEKFDSVEFTIALVNTVTIFPPAKPLKFFTAPLRAMFRKLDKVNPRFAKHFVGYLGKAVQKAKKGDFGTLWNTLPFMVLAAQLYTDEESREGLEFLFSTVDSADDIVSWIDYLGLPANGWEGEGDPPTVPAFDEDPQVSQELPLSWLVSQANAAPRVKVARIADDVLGKVLLRVKAHVGASVVKDIPDGLDLIRKSLRNADAKSLRKHVFSDELISVAGGAMMRRAGVQAIRNLTRGAKNTRYSIPAVVAMMAYLEYENSCGRALQEEAEQTDPGSPPPIDPVEKESERLNCDGKGFDKNIRRLVYSKIQTAFADRGDRNLKEEDPRKGDKFVLFGSGHGALFHLEQLAYYQAKYRLDSKERVKGSDAFRYVAFFDDEQNVPDWDGNQLLEREVIRRERYVDIVLEDDSGRETWVELKSYAAKSKASRTELDVGTIGNWRIGSSDRKGKKGYYPSLHRQFVIDRTANYLGGAWLAKNQSAENEINVVVPVKDFQWKFQKFSVDNRRSKRKQYSPDLGSERTKGTIRERLARLPKYNSDQNELVEVSMGRYKMDNMNHHVVDSGIASTLKEVLPGLGFEMIEEAVEDVVIEDID